MRPCLQKKNCFQHISHEDIIILSTLVFPKIERLIMVFAL
jgi:hypothetical protein